MRRDVAVAASRSLQIPSGWNDLVSETRTDPMSSCRQLSDVEGKDPAIIVRRTGDDELAPFPNRIDALEIEHVGRLEMRQEMARSPGRWAAAL